MIGLRRDRRKVSSPPRSGRDVDTEEAACPLSRCGRRAGTMLSNGCEGHGASNKRGVTWLVETRE